MKKQKMEPFLGVSGCICHPEAPCRCYVRKGRGLCISKNTPYIVACL